MGRIEVDGAIARVLAAERAANAAVGRCRAEAEARVQAGVARARAVLDRADHQIARVHALADRAIERELLRLQGEREELATRPEVEASERRAMEAAADALAREIVGLGEEP